MKLGLSGLGSKVSVVNSSFVLCGVHWIQPS